MLAHLCSKTTQDAISTLETGTLDFEGLTISAKDELISKLSFSKEGEQWVYRHW